MVRRKFTAEHWSDKQLNRLENPFRNLDVSVLNNYQRELNMLILGNKKALTRLETILHMVNEAVSQQHPSQSTNLIITDHAIVRYIERYTDFDINAVCETLINKAENGDPEIAMRDRLIVTVLAEGEKTDDTKPR